MPPETQEGCVCVLQRVAVQCSVVQCAALFVCYALGNTRGVCVRLAVCGSALQCIAVYCRVLLRSLLAMPSETQEVYMCVSCGWVDECVGEGFANQDLGFRV